MIPANFKGPDLSTLQTPTGRLAWCHDAICQAFDGKWPGGVANLTAEWHDGSQGPNKKKCKPFS